MLFNSKLFIVALGIAVAGGVYMIVKKSPLVVDVNSNK